MRRNVFTIILKEGKVLGVKCCKWFTFTLGLGLLAVKEFKVFIHKNYVKEEIEEFYCANSLCCEITDFEAYFLNVHYSFKIKVNIVEYFACFQEETTKGGLIFKISNPVCSHSQYNKETNLIRILHLSF